MPPFLSPCRRQRAGRPAAVAHPRKVIAKPDLGARPPIGAHDKRQMRPRHRIACGLQFGRHLNVDIGAAMRALDMDAAVLDVLRTKPDDLAAPRYQFQREFENEPLLRAERPVRTILLDFLVRPRVMALCSSET